MNVLPAGLADPLHLLQPSPYRGLLVAAGMLLMLALLAALWRRLRRRPATQSATPPPPPSAPPAAGIEQSIDKIRRRYLHADQRKGCHQLSATLRSHFEGGSDKPYTTLTVREIAVAIGDTAIARFFDLLADLQFGRREPSRNDFEGICELAHAVVAGGEK